MNEYLIKIIHIFHILITYFAYFGWLFPQQYLIYFILNFPFLCIHWMFNNNRCVISEIEYKLHGVDYPINNISPHTDIFFEEHGILILSPYKHIYTWLFIIAWLLGIVRYLYIYHKSVK